MRARVKRSSKREFECVLMDSRETVIAVALGNLLKDGQIVVGDYVEVEEQASGGYEIHQVEERTSEISRVLPRISKKKITASNCDLMIIVVSAKDPEYKRGIIDRFLVRAHQWGILPIVVLNKMDLYEEDLFDIHFEKERLASLGVRFFELAAKVPEYEKRYFPDGSEELLTFLEGKTAIVVGQSGVGKSKLVTALSGHKIELLSREIGKSKKGAHTTTWTELVDLGKFYLIDSPGIRSFSLEDILPEDLIALFPDLEEIAIHCKFNNCEHLEHSKGCAFHNLSEDEEEAIHSRLESYLRIKEEIGQTPAWAKKV